MKLDYIYHSGFAIEADGVTVIIDYYKDSSETEYNKGIVHDYLLGSPQLLGLVLTNNSFDAGNIFLDHLEL